MDDITYESSSDGQSFVRIKQEYLIPNANINQLDIFHQADLIIAIKDYNAIVLKNRYDSFQGEMNIFSIIDLFSNVITSKSSTKIEIFDEGIKSQIKNSILKVLKDNKLI
jgi:hypothetical protein